MSIQADRKVGTGHRIIRTHDMVKYIQIWTNKNDPISHCFNYYSTVLFLLLAYNK